MAKLPKDWFFDPEDPKQAPKLKEIETLSKAVDRGNKMIAEVIEELMQSNPASAKKLALGLAAVTSKDYYLKLTTKAEKARSGNAIGIQKKKSETISLRNQRIYADFLAMPKKSGWAQILARRYGLTSKSIENIVSEMKNGKAK